MARLNNGKLIDGRTYSGAEILKDVPEGRRVVEVNGKCVKNLDPRKNYGPEDIRRKIRVMPQRIKGGYFGVRSVRSTEMIRSQIVDVSEKLFKGATTIDYDDLRCDWMVVERYQLPFGWNRSIAPLMIIFPTEYPEIPPVGFYLPNTVTGPHLFDRAYDNASDAPLKQGWRWYCVRVQPGSWRPAWGRYADDWRKGDNLWDYFTLIGEVLGGSAE